MKLGALLFGLTCLALSSVASAQVATDLKVGNGVVSAMIMGEGDHVVIALHGGGGTDRRFFFGDEGGRLGQALAQAGFRVIAPTWSGQVGGGFAELNIAIAYARKSGARKISLMGHSHGGELAANYARQQPDGTFDTVIQLGSVDNLGLPLSQTKKLFAYNMHDPWTRWQVTAFDHSAEPKLKIRLNGSGHSVSALIGEKRDFAQDVIAILQN